MTDPRYVLALTLCAVLAGCATQPPESTTHQGAVADFRGIGQASAGIPLADVVRALGGSVDTSGGPIGDSNCNYAFLSALPTGTAVMTFGDTVVRFDVDTSGVPTAAGVEVGSTEADVRRAYTGAIVQQESHPYDGPEWHYLIVDSPSDTVHRIIFETDGQRVRSYRVGWRRAVDLIEGCS